MSRAKRLLDLIQLLRRHRYPVSGAAMASELGVSLRTLYRDIATLQSQGAAIEGEPGVGYVLRPGFTIPPLMFSVEELEAVVLGSRWVAERADERLSLAAKNALAKIADVLPPELREEVDGSPLLVPRASAHHEVWLGAIRHAIRSERKVVIRYRDGQENASARVIWPFAVGFFETVRVVAAWCELRDDFRSFRTDRIAQLDVSDEKYPRRRRTLLHEWRLREGVAER
jgi:predicted DNA-binding transcriptional regulator YafY